MRPIAPDESYGGKQVIFAENQPELLPLPARTDGEAVITAWELTAAERVAVLAGAPIMLQVITGGRFLQPVSLYVQGVEEEAGATE